MKGNMSRIFKNPIIKLGISIIFIGLMVLAYVMNITKGEFENKQNQLISINSIDVPEKEFRMFFQDEKASTADYFYKKYGAEYNDNFWETKYEGEIPINVAKKNALEKLIKVKIEQELAVEYGMLKSPLFIKIGQELKKEKNVYGVESLDLFQQYMTYHSKIVLETMNKYKLEFDGLKEEDIMRFYNKNKMKIFKDQDEIKASQISFVLQDNENKEELIGNILKEIHNGVTLEDLENKYNEQYQFSIQKKLYGHESKDENSSELETLLKEQAYMLKTHQISDPIQYGNQHFIIFCEERIEGKVREYTEVKNSIENFLKEEHFHQKVEDSVQKAVITMNENEYKKIQMH
jgi:hypothetical protein